jgi:hypothetical protein
MIRISGFWITYGFFIDQVLKGSLSVQKNKKTGQTHIRGHSTTATVSFDWFLSCAEWIINLKSCLLKLLIFYQNYYWKSDLGLTFPHFEFSRLYLDIHSVSYVYAVLPFYDVKCLCSWGREWGREGFLLYKYLVIWIW